jgi:hypothetical protein
VGSRESDHHTQPPDEPRENILSVLTYTDPSNIAMLSNVYAVRFVGMAECMQHGSGGKPTPIQQATQNVMFQSAALALDPVKDPSGNLYVTPDLMPQACGSALH